MNNERLTTWFKTSLFRQRAPTLWQAFRFADRFFPTYPSFKPRLHFVPKPLRSFRTLKIVLWPDYFGRLRFGELCLCSPISSEASSCRFSILSATCKEISNTCKRVPIQHSHSLSFSLYCDFQYLHIYELYLVGSNAYKPFTNPF